MCFREKDRSRLWNTFLILGGGGDGIGYDDVEGLINLDE